MSLTQRAVADDEVRSALGAVLASHAFTRSQQLSRLLKYLCDAVLAPGGDQISEYAIGTEALGRPSDFDPTQDAAGRVEMHRLRRRLREYYETEGVHDALRIVIPSGQYAPLIVRAGEERKEAPAPGAADSVGAPDPPPATTQSTDQRWTPLSRYASVGGLALLVLVPCAWLLLRTGGDVRARADSARNAPSAAAPVLPDLGLRIKCGRTSPWTDRLGQTWGPDQYFEGGQAIDIPARPYIAGTSDPRLYESARTGTFNYRIPLPARTYELRLYFIEPVYGPENQGGEASRLFRLFINGRKVFDRFDIIADADGSWIADVRVFKDIAPGPDGYVRLRFENVAGAALVNGIELLPARPHVLNPVRMLPQDNFYTDSAGNVWTPDNYSTGGRVSLHPGPVKNTHDQEIFRHERFGRFHYAIPVDRGLYSLYVYMAEEYWGPGNQGGGGEGTRVFDIFCNGTALLRNLDLLKEAGANVGMIRAFHHLTPNAQGKLLVSFEPEHDYASLYGIEVLDEAGPDVPSYQRTVSSTVQP